VTIDFLVLATAAGPVLGAIVGIALDRFFRERPNLIYFFIHAGAVKVRRPEVADTFVFTHFLVVRNVGGQTAHNVRLGHNNWTFDYSVYPEVGYQENPLPEGGKEIVFPQLVPKEQVTVSYLYAPPATADKINTFVKGDEGFARRVNALSTPQAPKWLIRAAVASMALGVTFVLYLLIVLIRLLLA
jgi:hypothetical protein